MLAGSRVYWHVALESPDDLEGVLIEVSLDGGLSWVAAERGVFRDPALGSAGVRVQGARFLVGPGTGLAEQPGVYRVLIRATDHPEIPLLDAGTRYVE